MCNREKREAALKMEPEDSRTWNLIFTTEVGTLRKSQSCEGLVKPARLGNSCAGALWWEGTGHVPETRQQLGDYSSSKGGEGVEKGRRCTGQGGKSQTM